MFGLYLLKDWKGCCHLMSSSKIHKSVMDRSKVSDYDWISSATDLISVCEKNKFPIEYEIDIKVAILNCFSRLINRANDSTHRKKTDLDAVYKAYNSLYKIQEDKVINARINFLKAFLKKVSHFKYVEIFMGESYHIFVEQWRNEKFKELFERPNINFKILEIVLQKEFEKISKKAKEQDAFLEGKKEHKIILEEAEEEILERIDKPKIKTFIKY